MEEEKEEEENEEQKTEGETELLTGWSIQHLMGSGHAGLAGKKGQVQSLPPAVRLHGFGCVLPAVGPGFTVWS